jgi:hypothetical protein
VHPQPRSRVVFVGEQSRWELSAVEPNEKVPHDAADRIADKQCDGHHELSHFVSTQFLSGFAGN